MEKAIKVKGLRKSFKDTEVLLKIVDFTVKRGEIFAALGLYGSVLLYHSQMKLI